MLALRLGRTVGELLDTMDSVELSEWMAYDHLSPIGDERQDLMSGIIASTIANANRSSSRAPFRPADMVPKWGKWGVKFQEPSSPQDLKQSLLAWAAAHNARAKK
jgi:Protein of unknown function (DUF4035)